VNDTPKKKTLKKRIIFAVKIAIFVIVFAWIYKSMHNNWGDLSGYDWELKWGWLAASAGFYLAGLLAAGLFWFTLLRKLGQDARPFETLRAYFIGHLGKYVPGKAMVVVIRAGLIGSKRVNTGVAAASVFFETLTMMACGSFISAVLLAFVLKLSIGIPVLGWNIDLRWGALGLMLVAGGPTIPPVFRFLVRLAKVGSNDPDVQKRLDRIGFGTLLIGWGCMTVCWLLLGLSLWAVLCAFGAGVANPWPYMPHYTATVALAMVAGFLSLIPGGIGPRDAILGVLMTPYFMSIENLPIAPAAAAIASAALLRVVWLVAELAISGVLYPCRGKRKE
jgi:glycosyltransferase 2 family protein